MAAMQSLAWAWHFDEFSIVQNAIMTNKKDTGGVRANRAWSCRTANLVLLNAMLAFTQNLSSFSTNKTVGALLIAICANIKQAAMVIVAFAAFGMELDWCGLAGVCTVLIAGICCSAGTALKANQEQRKNDVNQGNVATLPAWQRTG